MRALLVVNPKATTTNERSRDVLTRALRSEVELTVAYTRQRGHAAALVRQAADNGVDLVVTLGGDGTVNEAVNGLLPAEGKPDPYSLPALAVVPGGSTNVFARALGLPKDWAESTSVILDALRAGRIRTIGLGRADDRYFTFCAGLGVDAAVVDRVERARRKGRRSTPGLYLRSTLWQYLSVVGRQPAIALQREDHTDESLATVIVQNTAPWTYIGDRPVNPNPDASFDLGLDVLGLRTLHVPSSTRTVTQILSANTDPHGRRVLHLHDVDEFTLQAEPAQPFQVDGDYLGTRSVVQFMSVPNALRVVC